MADYNADAYGVRYPGAHIGKKETVAEYGRVGQASDYGHSSTNGPKGGYNPNNPTWQGSNGGIYTVPDPKVEQELRAELEKLKQEVRQLKGLKKYALDKTVVYTYYVEATDEQDALDQWDRRCATESDTRTAHEITAREIT